MAAVGTVLTLLAWFFLVGGTWRGLVRKEPLVRLHYLGIADTLGGLLLLAGLAFRHPERWLQLLLGALALLAWGPLTTYLVGWGATGGEAER